MSADRTATITIGGEEYTLILTTKATKEIVWLITVLANQSILIHNLTNKDNQKELLTEDKVELLTNPFDLATYKAAITEALYKGTKRNIASETNEKNAQVG